MKLSRNQIILTLALAACGAFAQSNNVPGAADYAAFSKFVTDRNIFDPNRQPHSTSTRTRTRTRTARVNNSAPQFSLVGTMAYEKGMFAFFSGNSDELKQILADGGSIAGYTVKEVSRGHAVLESADKKQRVELKIGDVMRQENGKWELSGQGEVAAIPAAAAAAAPASPGEESSDSAASPPATAVPPNDVLKRLMEKRAKENQ